MACRWVCSPSEQLSSCRNPVVAFRWRRQVSIVERYEIAPGPPHRPRSPIIARRDLPALPIPFAINAQQVRQDAPRSSVLRPPSGASGDGTALSMPPVRLPSSDLCGTAGGHRRDGTCTANVTVRSCRASVWRRAWWRPAERLSARLAMPLCADTLIRLVRRRNRAVSASPRVVGIDDWAWRRGHRYGSIVCDLEKRVIIDLLPDREMATAMSWLQRHPGIEVVSRDRGGGYAEAAKRALPNAIQVADRWHLFANASAAFMDAVGKHMPEIRKSLRIEGRRSRIADRRWPAPVPPPGT